PTTGGMTVSRASPLPVTVTEYNASSREALRVLRIKLVAVSCAGVWARVNLPEEDFRLLLGDFEQAARPPLPRVRKGSSFDPRQRGVLSNSGWPVVRCGSWRRTLRLSPILSSRATGIRASLSASGEKPGGGGR